MMRILLSLLTLACALATAAAQPSPPVGLSGDGPDLSVHLVDGKPVWTDPPPPVNEPIRTWSPKEQVDPPMPSAVTPVATDSDLSWEDTGDICLIVLVGLTCFAGFLYVVSCLEQRRSV